MVSRGNPGLSSYGFCIRDSNGDLVYAEAQQMGIATNMKAETEAIKHALKFCKEHNFQQVQLETDSLVLLNILQDTWITPWELMNQIEQIKQDMRAMQVQINHIFREGNSLANFLANQALDHAEIKVHDFILMPSEGRRILNMDKLQLPRLRIRTRRIQQFDHQQ
ncbi:uncharacterized protein LOC132639486 [Lycium barbarum]|uniref:uncharacterized protein LOC132639486 n=1 Tax=Lycium barbarum TaxID=112863 RepID=UPI00293F1DE9|nr:uncharacterized protein LOC132639486 [Lycium barbarum]